MNKLKPIYASAWAASIAIAAIVALTLGAELSSAFKNWLASFTGHHWLTKSWLSLIIFVLFFCLFHFTAKNTSPEKAKKAAIVLHIVMRLGFIVILGFYIYEFFGH